MPIGAGLADKIGRKPIFFFGFMMGMKGLLCNLIDSTEYMIHRDVQVRKPPLAPAFYAENDRFTKTGSGHTNIRGTKHSQKRSIPRLIDRYRSQGYLLYASALLSGMASGGGPVSMAMMVDIIPGCKQKNASF